VTDFLLALDQGTSSSRALLFDRKARLVAVRQIPLPIAFPRAGWVEQDAVAIWETQRDAARAVIRDACTAEDRIVGLGIANQRETTIVWDRRTLQPIGPAVGWQCRRTAEICRALKSSHGDSIRRQTGLVADPYFSGPKIAWLLDSVPGARERADRGELVAGTVDTWLLANLTTGAIHATDRTNASRTLIYDIHTGAWDAALATAQQVPQSVLADVQPSLGEFGVVDPNLLGHELPIVAVSGDQQAALFGQNCHAPGPVKVTYGTGAFLLTHTGPSAIGPVPGLLTTVAADEAASAEASTTKGHSTYALEGSVFSAGSIVQWLRDTLGLFEESAEIEALASSTADSAGVSLVPAFTGLGAPHWEPEARGMIAGISGGTSTAQIARAALEAIAFRVRDIVETLNSSTDYPVNELRVDGGAAANALLLQIQANAIGQPVIRPAQLETTALGVALMAGIVTGVWSDVAATEAAWTPELRITPNGDLDQAYTRWQAARDASIELGRTYAGRSSPGDEHRQERE